MAAGRGSRLAMRVHMDEEAVRELTFLAERFPKEMRRALGGVGYFMLRQMRESIQQGGPTGGSLRWARLSLMHIYQRMEFATGRSKAQYPAEYLTLRGMSDHQRANRIRGHPLPHAFSRWKKPWDNIQDAMFPMATLAPALRYRVRSDGTEVVMGGTTASVARKLRAVQDGAALPGSRGGSQRISDRMRVKFWIAGVPLGKGKGALERPRRPLIEPLYHTYGKAMIAFVIARVDVLLNGPLHEPRDVTARRVGLYRRFRTF